MSEDMIWHILDKQFCAFKATYEKKDFCKNEYNLTGFCTKTYCPLANGRYATIKEEDGILYLHIKTIERAHTPANLWEKIQLPNEMSAALGVINEQLAYWPSAFVHKVKERLVRLHQYLIRYRRWYYKAKPRLVTVNKKFERRDQKRELKALIAAKLDVAIKQELTERLKQGTYEFINLHNPQYLELLKEEKRREYLHNRKHNLKQDGVNFNDLVRSARKAVSGETTTTTTTTTEEENEAEVDLSKPNIQFMADDTDDLEDFEDDLDEDELEMENEYEEADEEQVQADGGDEEEDEDDELREDILKHIPFNLNAEAGDDSEMAGLKKRLLLKRKKRLLEKAEEEKKRARASQKKRKHYGAHVEIEYEPTTVTQTSRH